MYSTPLLDSAGRRRSPATTASFHEGSAPRNKGLRYPPDPLTVEEIVAVMRASGDTPESVRLREIIVVFGEPGCALARHSASTRRTSTRTETTQIYLHADLELKQRAISRHRPTRHQTPDATSRQTHSSRSSKASDPNPPRAPTRYADMTIPPPAHNRASSAKSE
jgi:hypothetical protein